MGEQRYRVERWYQVGDQSYGESTIVVWDNQEQRWLMRAEVAAALNAADDAARLRDCGHDDKAPLLDAGEYGSTVVTDWEWCRRCGAIRLRPTARWLLPKHLRLTAPPAAVLEAGEEAV